MLRVPGQRIPSASSLSRDAQEAVFHAMLERGMKLSVPFFSYMNWGKVTNKDVPILPAFPFALALYDIADIASTSPALACCLTCVSDVENLGKGRGRLARGRRGEVGRLALAVAVRHKPSGLPVPDSISL